MDSEYTTVIPVQADTTSAYDMLSRSSAAAADMLRRRGLDAAGLTDEFEAKYMAQMENLEKAVPDPVRRQRIATAMSETFFQQRESVRKYELQQMYDGAIKHQSRKLDDAQFRMSETLNIGIAAGEDNAAMYDRMASGFAKMHKEYYDGLVDLGLSQEEAMAEADAQVRKRAMGMIIASTQSRGGAGLSFSQHALSVLEAPDTARIGAGDGFDRMGRLCMLQEDINRIRSAYESEVSSRNRMMQADAAKDELAQMSTLGRISSSIEDMFRPKYNNGKVDYQFSSMQNGYEEFTKLVNEMRNIRDGEMATKSVKDKADTYINEGNRLLSDYVNGLRLAKDRADKDKWTSESHEHSRKSWKLGDERKDLMDAKIAAQKEYASLIAVARQAKDEGRDTVAVRLRNDGNGELETVQMSPDVAIRTYIECARSIGLCTENYYTTLYNRSSVTATTDEFVQGLFKATGTYVPNVQYKIKSDGTVEDYALESSGYNALRQTGTKWFLWDATADTDPVNYPLVVDKSYVRNDGTVKVESSLKGGMRAMWTDPADPAAKPVQISKKNLDAVLTKIENIRMHDPVPDPKHYADAFNEMMREAGRQTAADDASDTLLSIYRRSYDKASGNEKSYTPGIWMPNTRSTYDARAMELLREGNYPRNFQDDNQDYAPDID